MATSERPTTNDVAAAEVLLQDPSSSSVHTMTPGAPQLPSHISQIVDHELNSPSVPSIADIQAYPTGAYLNKTVIPIVIEGLSVVAQERPTKPIEFLAAFFFKNRERFGETV